MSIKDFNQTLDTWIKELEQYDFSRLLVKPSPGSWSLGQVYMHLIKETRHFIKQIHICTSTNDNLKKEAFSDGKKMLRDNKFPDAILEGPPSNADTPQPASKDQLTTELLHLKDEINTANTRIEKSQFKGKTKHPGLGYFSANEWLQFAEMHFRHHLRQKKRIDDFIQSQKAKDKI